MFNTVGFSAGVRGEKKEEIGSSASVSELLPFEFAEFAHELITNALVMLRRERVVLLCDEANCMPVSRQEQILERYLELFSARQVQFVFVAGVWPRMTDTYLPKCFETSLELLGFPGKQFVAELIESELRRFNAPCPTFSDEAIEALVDAYKGHPRFTLDACASAFQHALESGQAEVSASSMFRVCRELDERLKEAEEALLRQATVSTHSDFDPIAAGNFHIFGAYKRRRPLPFGDGRGLAVDQQSLDPTTTTEFPWHRGWFLAGEPVNTTSRGTHEHQYFRPLFRAIIPHAPRAARTFYLACSSRTRRTAQPANASDTAFADLPAWPAKATARFLEGDFTGLWYHLNRTGVSRRLEPPNPDFRGPHDPIPCEWTRLPRFAIPAT